MESNMTRSAAELGHGGGERRLPPDRWEIIRSQTRERAHELRSQMLHDFGGWLLRRPGEILRGFLAWRQRRKAVHELQRLDNRMLHDLGVARSEIEYLVAGGDPDRRMPRKAAARRAPCAAPNAAKGRNVAIERHAA